MFSIDVVHGQSKPAVYRDLLAAALALTDGESDAVANMANIAALIPMFVGELNWAGFYRVQNNELILGPFWGKPACNRIALGQGVCGTAAALSQTQLVEDVHTFAGHIACDSASRSELVVPVRLAGRVIAVIDLDSPLLARFDAEDAAGIEALSAAIADRI